MPVDQFLARHDATAKKLDPAAAAPVAAEAQLAPKQGEDTEVGTTSRRHGPLCFNCKVLHWSLITALGLGTIVFSMHEISVDIVGSPLAHELVPRLKFNNEGPRAGMALLFASPASLRIEAFCSLVTALPATFA